MRELEVRRSHCRGVAAMSRAGLALSFTLGALTAGAAEDLWSGFREPPAEARPFVRWWWNGNRVTEAEILRELDLLKEAGVASSGS